MRKLASVQKIKEIIPIEDADRIELAKVLGWQCVVNKGQFKPGDYCVYFEIDSFLPIDPRFEFLRASSYKNSELLGEGFRLRTMKFRGQISQGLCLPASDFPELWHDDVEGMNCVVPCEGQDVTEKLHVRKWEVPEMATSGGTVIGTLPWDVPHTDETRIQNAPELLDEFGDLPYYITTKMDGSSHSISVDEDGNIHVCGHNYEYADDGKSSFYEFVKNRGILERIRAWYEANKDVVKSIVIQGEYCGAGIQQNRLRLTQPEWYVFTIKENGERLGLGKMFDDCDEMELEHVPLEEVRKSLKKWYPSVETLLKRAEGQYPNGGQKEGIVVRPADPVFSKTLSGPLSLKVINNKYLLKNQD